MGREREVTIRLSQSELARISAAAQQIGLEETTFLRHAALALAGNIKPRQYGKYELNSIYREAASRGHVWTEAELLERGLPLYWNEAWVRARLAEGKSVKQLAILCGSYVTSVQNHLQAAYNIRAFRTLTESQITSIRERYAAGDTRQEIAADLGVSNTTIGKHLTGLPTRREREAREMRERLQSPHVQDAPVEGPVAPNVQGLRDWSERLFAERAATLTWPTSTQIIADTLFDGNRGVARDWTGRMVRKGRLRRLTRGWFVLADGRDDDVQ
ncbi:Hin recombinase (plasmid) [Deinococcus sp. D7000]|nr:Hin recombinase [Deinococcus sp. D7000]